MNNTDTQCATCGLVITDESPSGDRKPCPQCSSLARAFSLQAHSVAHISTSAEVSVISYPQTLLAACKGLIDDEQFGIAVVVAHMACEIATERALSEAFAEKGLQYLEEPVLSFLNGYNLSNDKNRKLYSALTGNSIEQQPFWSDFKESATRRNKIVHSGAIINKLEAENSFQATSAFVDHLNLRKAQ